MIVTVNLSKGAITMSRKKVIVKRLNSIQNFGAMDVLCTDKTGTLTQDEVILEKHCDVLRDTSDEGVLQYAYLNSYYQTGLKNLLDKAILEHKELWEGLKADRITARSTRSLRLRTKAHVGRGGDYEGLNTLICKGAVEEILNRMHAVRGQGRGLSVIRP